MLPLVFFFTLSLAFIFTLIFVSFYTRKHRKHEEKEVHQGFANDFAACLSETAVNKNGNTDTEHGHGSDPTRFTHSLILDRLLPDDSPNPGRPFIGEVDDKNESGMNVLRVGDEEEGKKSSKKKRTDPNGNGEEERKQEKGELVASYPFTTPSGATQRRVKQQYDQLVKSHETNGLTFVQVVKFVNCLIETRKELQHRSGVIQRKFTITKALLLKAERSSFDRLQKQIYKLEFEQKKLEEDASVYNWLQQQFKLSPAYKKTLEISASMGMQAKSCKQVESIDNEVADISFEELLAQEKKDAFWQRNGKAKSCSV